MPTQSTMNELETIEALRRTACDRHRAFVSDLADRGRDTLGHVLSSTADASEANQAGESLRREVFTRLAARWAVRAIWLREDAEVVCGHCADCGEGDAA